MMKDKILAAAKADAIPEGESGLWFVKKFTYIKRFLALHCNKPKWIEPGSYTKLFRVTDSTMHTCGECVMHDTPEELRTHLEFMLKAKGDVLITGLGLGCVVRGCLANPNVRSVVCIEKSKDVLKLVEPYMPTERLKIVRADALLWCAETDLRFDCAWHDIWTDTDRGEPHLAVAHTQLICHTAGKVAFQGAWNYPRHYRRLMRQDQGTL